MLVCYAKELKEGFADYVEETVKLLVPLLKFYLHDNVRIAAAESLPFLIESGQAKVTAYVSLCSFLHSFLRSLVSSFFRVFIHSFICSFVPSFFPSFVASFEPSFVA